MRDLVPEHGVDFILIHPLQQPRAHRDQRVIAACTGGEGVRLRRLEDADFGHADACGRRVPAHGFHQPRLGGARRLLDDPDAHGALGHPLRDGEGDEGTAEAEQGGEHEQPLEAAAAHGEVAVETQNLGDDGQDDENCEVGREKQQDAFHGGVWSSVGS